MVPMVALAMGVGEGGARAGADAGRRPKGRGRGQRAEGAARPRVASEPDRRNPILKALFSCVAPGRTDKNLSGVADRTATANSYKLRDEGLPAPHHSSILDSTLLRFGVTQVRVRRPAFRTLSKPRGGPSQLAMRAGTHIPTPDHLTTGPASRTPAGRRQRLCRSLLRWSRHHQEKSTHVRYQRILLDG